MGSATPREITGDCTFVSHYSNGSVQRGDERPPVTKPEGAKTMKGQALWMLVHSSCGRCCSATFTQPCSPCLLIHTECS